MTAAKSGGYGQAFSPRANLQGVLGQQSPSAMLADAPGHKPTTEAAHPSLGRGTLQIAFPLNREGRMGGQMTQVSLPELFLGHPSDGVVEEVGGVLTVIHEWLREKTHPSKQ